MDYLASQTNPKPKKMGMMERAPPGTADLLKAVLNWLKCLLFMRVVNPGFGNVFY